MHNTKSSDFRFKKTFSPKKFSFKTMLITLENSYNHK